MVAAAATANQLAAAAQWYVTQGWPVFPCHPETKMPLVKGGFKSASRGQAEIALWWRQWPNAMIGVPTGPEIGAWVLDVDNPAEFEAACAKLDLTLPGTKRASSGKGYHYYFAWDDAAPVHNRQQHPKTGWPFPDLPGAETRGIGGYIIVPPSVHPSGRSYAWISNEEPSEAPADLIEIIGRDRERGERRSSKPTKSEPFPSNPFIRDTPYGLAALKAECDTIRGSLNGTQEGALNDGALKIGALVGGAELTLETARRELISAGLQMSSFNAHNPWTVETITYKVDRALRDGAATPRSAPKGRTSPEGVNDSGVALSDFRAFMPTHNYIFMPSGEFWPAASVNARIKPMPILGDDGEPIVDDKGKPKTMTASAWLDKNKPVEQVTWAPGEPPIVADRLISDGGWLRRAGCNVFNLYRPPSSHVGDAAKAKPWIDHIERIYPVEADHIIKWLAHRVQRPHEKINHALVLGGAQGIGKDTLLEPVKQAIGPWNFAEVSPQHMLGRFNGFVKSVILRVSEARDLGDIDRFAFYDHMKTYTAAPPDVLRVDEKFKTEYSAFNVCGVIVTSNHKTDGIYLPADDRRHFVAWSSCGKEDFSPEYWGELYRWYSKGGNGHVAAYLAQVDLGAFDAKAPPPKTEAFWDIISANQAPEDAELADALDRLNRPVATTITIIAAHSEPAFAEWLSDRKNRRRIPHRMEECGYVAVRNSGASDGLWAMGGKRTAIYARKELSIRERHEAAERMASHR